MAEVGGSTPLISTTDIETADSLLRVGSFFYATVVCIPQLICILKAVPLTKKYITRTLFSGTSTKD